MLTFALKSTSEYLNLYPKKHRKLKGQFFTCNSTAYYMAGLFSINKAHIRLLDPGAGTGILSVAAVEKLFENEEVKAIELDLFENDITILPLLIKNIEHLKEIYQAQGKNFTYKVYNQNFILYFSKIWNNHEIYSGYDAVICNPPYCKIGKDAPEANIMKSVVYGQPNLYFLFMALSAKLLNNNGEMIFIVPRSWVSGLYFTKFRDYFLSNIKLKKIHLFIARDKVFRNENVLQETIIVKAQKTKHSIEQIEISTSNGSDEFIDLQTFKIQYNICVNSKNRFVYLPASQREVQVLALINNLSHNLISLGYKAKTGLVVDFRSKEYLTNSPANSIPLLWPQNFCDGKIKYPNTKIEFQYILPIKKSLLMKNGYYLLLKRFSSKEEKRRLQAAIVPPADYDYISTENHLNFIVKQDGSSLDEAEIWGLYTIFNSTIWDHYFRILNGSTQVNSNELNSLNLPDKDTIFKIGNIAREKQAYSTEDSDLILEEILQWQK